MISNDKKALKNERNVIKFDCLNKNSFMLLYFLEKYDTITISVTYFWGNVTYVRLEGEVFGTYRNETATVNAAL